jgi:lipid-A-disaccharide synthase
MTRARLSILFLAGDPSGDQHAAPVIRRLRRAVTELNAFGLGGPRMVQEGFSPHFPFEEFNRMGFADVIGNLRFFLRARRQILSSLRTRPPDAVVCVDYASFNMPIMKAASRLGIPVIWYIAPKVWVWKKYRARVVGTHASAIATILPFEPAWFQGYSARVSYVGNPLVEAAGARVDHVRRVKQAFSGARPWRIALVPGSRRQEIAAMLEPMIEAAASIRDRGVALEARVSRYRQIDQEVYEPATRHAGVTLDSGPLPALYAWADCALITSGTATLEAAIAQTPFVLAYRTHPLNWIIGNMLVRLSHIGLPNIIAGREIIPELLQNQATGERLAEELLRFMRSMDQYAGIVGELRSVRESLGSAVPSAEVAKMILGAIERGEQ